MRRRPISRARRASASYMAARSTKPTSAACARAATSRSVSRIWRRSRQAAGHDVAEARVDVEDLAGYRRGEVGQKEGRRVAHVLGRHIAPQRRMLLDELEDLAEAADSRCGE